MNLTVIKHVVYKRGSSVSGQDSLQCFLLPIKVYVVTIIKRSKSQGKKGAQLLWNQTHTRTNLPEQPRDVKIPFSVAIVDTLTYSCSWSIVVPCDNHSQWGSKAREVWIFVSDHLSYSLQYERVLWNTSIECGICFLREDIPAWWYVWNGRGTEQIWVVPPLRKQYLSGTCHLNNIITAII